MRLSFGRVMLIMWVEKLGASLHNFAWYQICKAAGTWQSTVTPAAGVDLDKNKPDPFSKSLFMNSALGRHRNEGLYGFV